MYDKKTDRKKVLQKKRLTEMKTPTLDLQLDCSLLKKRLTEMKKRQKRRVLGVDTIVE